jgi:tripartite ATP-independent transporter DctP family solute receptor
MLRKSRCLVLAMALILVVVSCTSFAAVKPVKLIYGHIWAADHFYCKGDLYFKKLVEKKSKGKILIDYFPASQLGTEREMLQATMSGAQQMVLTSWNILGQWWPKLQAFELPYLIRDEAHQLKLLDKLFSLVDPDELAAKTGVRIIGLRLSSPRHLYSKIPINKFEDLKGLKIRLPETPVFIAFWKESGAIPTVIPLTDAYTALATGTANALEGAFDQTYSQKFYEQVKYCALTGHMRGFYLMAINYKFWNNLTRMQKKIIQDAADKSTKFMVKESQKSEEGYKKLLVKEGMKFTKPDLDPFREKAKILWKRFGDQDLIKKIDAVK